VVSLTMVGALAELTHGFFRMVIAYALVPLAKCSGALRWAACGLIISSFAVPALRPILRASCSGIETFAAGSLLRVSTGSLRTRNLLHVVDAEVLKLSLRLRSRRPYSLTCRIGASSCSFARPGASATFRSHGKGATDGLGLSGVLVQFLADDGTLPPSHRFAYDLLGGVQRVNMSTKILLHIGAGFRRQSSEI